MALGTTLGGMRQGQRFHEAYVRKGPGATRASRVQDHLAHAQPLHVAAEFDIPVVPLVFGNACASGANAVGHGFRAVRAGDADVALCGGYDPLCEFAFAGFQALQALTPELCRPFDRDRSGLTMGEGAAVLVLEDRAAARGRGARCWGEVIGYGESNDAFHMTRPDPQGTGAARAIRRALEDAGLAPEDVDYVNAHGTGTPFNDASETAAVLAALGEWGRDVPVSSTKPLVGHLLGAAGAAEAVLTLLALREGRLPPNANYAVPDPACALRVLRDSAPADARVALSNSFGFGGANATLAFRRAEA
jgi:3-oxoacyl-[acyl-carrier-protein] synthase II